MSTYSDLLRKYITKKNIKIVQLIQYCELERSYMYKIINGKRKPASLQMVQKIADFMQLSPIENQEYYQAYYRTVFGDELYEQNRQIQEMIYNFDQIIQRPVYLKNTESIVNEQLTGSEPFHILHGKLEIDCHMKLLLESEAQLPSPYIRLIAQCEYSYLLQTLMTLGRNNPDMVIQHILCFQNEEEYSCQNIELIQHILGFYACECQYEPFYYYDTISSHFDNMNLFCNCIICSKGILCYTNDYSYGQLISDSEGIKAYRNLFEQYIHSTYPVLTKVDSIIKEYLSVGQSVLIGTSQPMAYSLHAQPCVVPFITDELLGRKLRAEIPQREQVLKVFSQYIKEEKNAIDIGNFTCFFTADGIEEFILQGKLSEIPDSYYIPFEQKDCLEIMERMIPYFENGKYRLLKNRLAKIENNLHIFMAPSTGHFLFSNVKKELIYININESGIIRQFYRFMESLNEELSLYTTSEAVAEVERILSKYCL